MSKASITQPTTALETDTNPEYAKTPRPHSTGKRAVQRSKWRLYEKDWEECKVRASPPNFTNLNPPLIFIYSPLRLEEKMAS